MPVTGVPTAVDAPRLPSRFVLRSPFAALLALCATPSWADATTGATQVVDAVDLDALIVTASRGSETLGQSLASVSVITRDDIERLQAQDLSDLFAGLPGVSIANNGGVGKSTSLFLRGTESDHTLVMLDGIKIGSATSGSAAFEQIPVDQIERIEIVRGPRSSLYGSEAIGGVIQIFTRRGSAGGAAQPFFAIGAGNRGSSRAEAGLRGGIGTAGWYSLGLGARRTDGIDARPSTGEHDRDGFESLSGSLAGGWRFANGTELSINWLRAQSENEYDGSSQNQADNTQQTLGANLSATPLAHWRLLLNAGQSRDLSDNFRNGSAVGAFDTRRDYAAWINEIDVAAGQQLSLGADHQRDRVGGKTDYAENDRRNSGVFAQYRAQLGAHDVQASLRHDDNEQFGGRETGGLAYGYRIGPALRLGASYGTAFKAPTFNELYFPNYGNADLDPERSDSIELSASGAIGVAHWAVNAFETRVDDLIAYDADIEAPNNIDEARIRGVETQLGARIDDLRVQAAWTWLDPENRAPGADNGKLLPRRARSSGRVDLDYDFSRYAVGASVFAAGKRYDNVSNSSELGGYATLALRAEAQLWSPGWRLQLSGSNLLDRDYETAATYAQPGRSYFVTLRYTPPV